MTRTQTTRADRLAAKLRENLHRRKDQAREQKAAAPADSPDLPKPPASR